MFWKLSRWNTIKNCAQLSWARNRWLQGGQKVAPVTLWGYQPFMALWAVTSWPHNGCLPMWPWLQSCLFRQALPDEVWLDPFPVFPGQPLRICPTPHCCKWKTSVCSSLLFAHQQGLLLLAWVEPLISPRPWVVVGAVELNSVRQALLGVDAQNFVVLNEPVQVMHFCFRRTDSWPSGFPIHFKSQIWNSGWATPLTPAVTCECGCFPQLRFLPLSCSIWCALDCGAW